ncbi:MAG: protease complex subunit PrcB family protein [Caldilineaceae bacterium]|nr:protease complex subunit PrcB family protein [Caldilineaceae bacterium]MBP8107930.1 protease complex subunit PrcB family protein [Caldilineaceae bacterium]MBP8123002.1 protease complex subunit PrcB family protein [Caldilineaceae bacterium]MBP9073003.1 protease complex subunit PrcB family protein [Caldilineaceae bacterium]
MSKLAVVFILLAGVLLTACSSGASTPGILPVHEDERVIPFQTIDVDNGSRWLLPESAGVPEMSEKLDSRTTLPGVMPTVSHLYKIESVQDIEPLIGLLPSATVDYLHDIDYDTYIVFALLRGLRGEGRRETFIERISVSEDFNVYAQFWVPAEGVGVTQAYTFPYHIVKVSLRDMFPSDSRPSFISVNLLARLCDGGKYPC